MLKLKKIEKHTYLGETKYSIGEKLDNMCDVKDVYLKIKCLTFRRLTVRC